MNRIAIAIATLALLLSGCAGMLSALAVAAQGAQYLGTVIDVADAGADAYLARHPSREAQDRIDTSVRRARQALAALDHALALGEAATQDDIAAARTEAIAAYAELRQLLDDLGVLSATPPAGGAETDAPLPEPIYLPAPDDLERLM